MNEGTRKMEEMQAQQEIINRIQGKYPEVSFPEPVLEPLYIGRLARKPVDGRFAVVDSRNGEVFGLCTDQYKLVHHEEVLDSISEAITGTKEFGAPKVAIKMFGGKMTVDLIWDSKKNKKEVRKGDFIAPRIRVKNSYDLGWKLEYSFGAMQLVCTNGMTALKMMNQVARRHVTSLRPDVFANEICTGLHNFGDQVALWEAWAGTKMKLAQVMEVVEALPFSETEMKKVLELPIIGQPENLSLSLMGERKVPISLWDVHSSATQYLTHNVASPLRKVEDEVEIENVFTRAYENLSVH